MSTVQDMLEATAAAMLRKEKQAIEDKIWQLLEEPNPPPWLGVFCRMPCTINGEIILVRLAAHHEMFATRAASEAAIEHGGGTVYWIRREGQWIVQPGRA
jgi:hypothetical protein